MKSCLYALVLVTGLSQVGQALAAEDPCLRTPEPRAADDVLQELRIRRSDLMKCYDVGSHAPASLETLIKLLATANAAKTPADRRQALTSVLEELNNWMTTGLKDAALREKLRVKVSQARTALETIDVSNDVLNSPSWTIVERPSDGAITSKVFDKDDFTTPIRVKCIAQAASPDGCRTAIVDIEGVLRSHNVVEVALRVLNKDAMAELADLFSKRNSMWTAYRTEARPQYPWEWLLNGALYRDDRPKDEAGNPRGPASLPKGQVILLHPGVGLEQFNVRGTDQSSSNPTLYMEWIGYNRLQWNYGDGTLRGGLGVSIVGVYAPRQDASDWSHGLMFWVSNKYGLAVTRNGGGTSIMISMDLGELYRDKLNQVNESLRSSLSSK